MISIPWMIAGGVGWTASEYVIHRFVGHGPKRAAKTSLLQRLTPSGLAYEFNREHLAHHTDPSYFAPTYRKVMAAAAVIPGVTAALAPIVGGRRAISFALGFGIVYGAYEVVHRQLHTRAPRGRYGRWVRRHHLYHHHKTPRQNHGVTTAAWDYLFGTKSALEKVRVPRKVAPKWMIDERTGEVAERFESDYELVPRRSAVSHEAA
ncbi:hypothetical protein BH09MYX1_BH09MYX1_53120 [soil metagenome]